MSMSDVVIRSAENGPNLVIVDGKVMQAWCRWQDPHLLSFGDGTQEKRIRTRKHLMPKPAKQRRNKALFL